MNNQGGSVLLDIIILSLIVITLGVIFWVIGVAREPSQVSVENAKSIKNMSEHLEKIDTQLSFIDKDLKELKQSKVSLATWDNLDSQVSANKLEIDNLKSRSDKNDQIMVENINMVKDNLRSIPKMIERKLSVMNRPVTVQLAPQKTIGYERIVQKNDQKYKQMIYKTQPLKDEKKSDKYKMPGIKEAKDKIVEAGL